MSMIITFVIILYPAVPSTGLFFTLPGGRIYLPGQTVLITDIGAGNAALACDTRNVNSQCCAASDADGVTRVQAEWLFPSGTIVTPDRGMTHLDFTRSVATRQLRLNHRNNALAPLGAFTCHVPDSGGGNQTATISLILGKMIG